MCAHVLLDTPAKDEEAVLLLVRYHIDRAGENLAELRAALQLLDTRTDGAAPAAQVLCEEIVTTLLLQQQSAADSEVPLPCGQR